MCGIIYPQSVLQNLAKVGASPSNLRFTAFPPFLVSSCLLGDPLEQITSINILLGLWPKNWWPNTVLELHKIPCLTPFINGFKTFYFPFGNFGWMCVNREYQKLTEVGAYHPSLVTWARIPKSHGKAEQSGLGIYGPCSCVGRWRRDGKSWMSPGQAAWHTQCWTESTVLSQG